MRFKAFPILIILAFLCLSLMQGDYHKVKFIYDGDTIVLECGEKVRYQGINTPEIEHKTQKSEFMAFVARDLNTNLVGKSRIRLEYDKTKRDQYGRLIAYVFLENGDMVNAILVRKGLAHVMFTRDNLKYKNYLLRYQREAMKKNLGIWSRPLTGEEKIYLGNNRSYRFHRPDCPFGKKISRGNLVKFRSPYDAYWKGYSPCNDCRP